MRAGATDQIENYPYVPFFPRTRALPAANLTSRGVIEQTFVSVNFQVESHQIVVGEVAENWRAYADKTAHRADSILAQLSDIEFETGLGALRQYAVEQALRRAVTEPVDLFVFRKI